MAFVEDHVSQVFRRLQVEHIAQDLRGHDQDRSLGVHLHVAGQDPDVFSAKLSAKVSIFLVAEGLDGSGIGDALPIRQGPENRKLGDQGLASSGWG